MGQRLGAVSSIGQQWVVFISDEGPLLSNARFSRRTESDLRPVLLESPVYVKAFFSEESLAVIVKGDS